MIFETKNFSNKSSLVAKTFTTKTKNFNNVGKISCSDDIDIQCDSFINNSGRIESHKNIIIKAENTLENKGGGTLRKNVTENIKIYEEEKRGLHMDERAGAYSETKLVEKIKTITKDIYSPQLDKSGIITTDNGKLEIYSKSINNSFGIMNSKKGVLLNGTDIIKNECGLVVSGNDLIIKSKQFKNGHKGSPQTFSSIDPNKPIIKPGLLITDVFENIFGREYEKISFGLIEEKSVDLYRKNIHRVLLLRKPRGEIKSFIKLSNKITGYEKYNHTVESSQYPGYLFAQDNISIFSKTDVYLGTIVSGKNINISGKNFSSINIKDRGTIIANGNVNLEMKRASIEQAKIQAENISMKILENFTIEGVIQPVVLLDGSIIMILDLKKFAEIIGIFSKNPNIAHELLDLTEVSLKSTKTSGFINEGPKSDIFISSLPDEQMRNVVNLLLTPIHGRNILQNPHLIQYLEYSGYTANNSKNKKLIKNDNPMILYQKTEEEEVIINDNGEEQTVSIYNPQLILNTLSKAVSFLEAQKKISIESMKNIKINPENFNFECDLSLKAKEKVSLMSNYIYDDQGNRKAVDKVNLKCNDLTISGNEGVELRAADIDAKNVEIISSNGDITDDSMSLDYWVEKKSKLKYVIHESATSNINSQESICMKAKNIDLTGTNISTGKNLQLNAENIEFKPSYIESSFKGVSGRKKYDGYSKIVKPQKINVNGNIEFNAKNVNLFSTNIFTLNSIKNNVNGNFNISAAYDHIYAHSFYKKRRLFGSCSREQTEITDNVRPAQIVAKEIQSLGVGTVKIESAIIKTINMHITKDLIETSLDNKYESHDVIKRRGFFAPRVRGDPLKESLKALKRSVGGDIFPQTIGLASSVIHTCNHIKTLANLASLPNPTMQLASVLLSRFTTVSLYSKLKQVHNIHRKIPVQSNVEVGLFKLKNNKTHLEGIWDIDKASIETDVLTAKSPKMIDEQNIKLKGWSIDFNLGSIISNFIIPCVFVPKILLAMPSININKGKQSFIVEKIMPMKLKANNLFIRCNDAVFSGAQIHSKIVDAIVEGKLTIESLTNLYDYKSKHSNISFGLSSIFGSVINETYDGSLFGKLKRIPSIRIANKTILSKKVEEVAELIGTERFYLKAGELLYTNPSIIALLPEGSFLHSENEQIIVGKLHSEKIEEVYQEKSRIINPSISEMIKLMENLNDYQRIQASAIKEAIENGYSSKVISKIEKEISAFLNNKEIKSCIQEMNENLQKLNKSINNISDIAYDNPDEKSMPQEILHKYHSTSQMIGEQIHDSLKCGTEIFSKYDQFLDKNSEMKHIYKNSLFSLSDNIIDGLIKVPIIFCKDSLNKYQHKFSTLYESKALKGSLIEELPDKIVDLARSYANNDVEEKEFAKIVIFGLNNINSKSYKIKNIQDFNEKIRIIEESVQESCIDREKLRNESSQSISEFLDKEIVNTIKFVPIGLL